MFFASSRLRMVPPTVKNRSRPRINAISCFTVSSGCTVQIAAMPKVHRKKAAVSTSKAGRLMMKYIKSSTHCRHMIPANPVKIERAFSVLPPNRNPKQVSA